MLLAGRDSGTGRSKRMRWSEEDMMLVERFFLCVCFVVGMAIGVFWAWVIPHLHISFKWL